MLLMGTWTPKVCKVMAFMAVIVGLGSLFYILLGLRQGLGFRVWVLDWVLGGCSRGQGRGSIHLFIAKHPKA